MGHDAHDMAGAKPLRHRNSRDFFGHFHEKINGGAF
jgi:hypothetical protein